MLGLVVSARRAGLVVLDFSSIRFSVGEADVLIGILRGLERANTATFSDALVKSVGHWRERMVGGLTVCMGLNVRVRGHLDPSLSE